MRHLNYRTIWKSGGRKQFAMSKAANNNGNWSGEYFQHLNLNLNTAHSLHDSKLKIQAGPVLSSAMRRGQDKVRQCRSPTQSHPPRTLRKESKSSADDPNQIDSDSDSEDSD